MVANVWRCASALALVVCCSMRVEALTHYVAAGGNLQATINAANPGDTILLEEGAEFVGNFVLPVKTGDLWITIRSSAPDTVLPPAGVRVQPSHAPLLARLRSSTMSAALRTAPGAHHWNIQYLEFAANQNGYGDIIQVGDGSSAQNSLALVPHHIVLSHIYVHGDVRFGQKRCIALNAAQVTIRDSHVTECKGVGQDTQAICGWNGPGPFVIENNHLEAAGEVVMFGGADPAIADLVPQDITLRRNHLTRPMAWRQPIIGTPTGLLALPTTGGSLVSGIYAYRVVARGSVGQGSTGRSTASAEVVASVTTDSGGAVQIEWQPVAGASEYRVYGRTAGAQGMYWTVSGTAFLDTGAAGTTEAVPTGVGTVWTVKNLFELKNARNVTVEDNIFENHWKDAQPGWAVVLTPRNPSGACTWCVVEHVSFQYNIVRNVAAGITLLGYDSPSRPTRQSNDINIRHNLFHNVTTTLGGNGWFMQVGDEPRDLTIEHNTIDSNGATVVYTYGGTSTDPREIYGLRMTANAARHGVYGFNGAFFSYGNGILNGFYPGYVFSANYLAGGSASRYPAGTLVAGAFTDQFVDPVNGDFTLRAGSALRGAAPDGSDIGVDTSELGRRLVGVDGVARVAPTAGFAFTCSGLTCEFSSTSTAGDQSITLQTWDFGDGTQGTGAETSHTFQAAGTFAVTLTVTDQSGLSSTTTTPVTVVSVNGTPVAAFTWSCTGLACTFSDASQDADGQIVSATWSFGDGATASGAQVAHSFGASGTYPVTVTVEDNGGAAASSTTSITVQAAVQTALHAAFVSGTATLWTKSRNTSNHSWNVEVVLAVHGVDERPVAGATITAAWTGATTKGVSCVTDTTGLCTVKSGPLSLVENTVSLSITAITASQAVYDNAGDHSVIGGTNTSTSIVMFVRP